MKLSILNLAPVREGQTYLQAVESMVSLAKHAENIGIERYWIAEHHNMKNLVSSATALLIQHTLANTKTLRVGSGYRIIRLMWWLSNMAHWRRFIQTVLNSV